jgi:hypothetical protein
MEKINVFVIALPTFDSVVDRIKDAIEEKFEKPKFKKPSFLWDEDKEEDLTPKRLRVNEPCNGIQPWGIGGTPADENLRFGYQAPPIDEPRCEDYDCRWEFEDDHEAYDKLVDAAEDCVARGLARPDGVIEHKCNAVRKRLNEVPPMNLPLIGETHWFDEDIEWPY